MLVSYNRLLVAGRGWPVRCCISSVSLKFDKDK